MAEFEGLRLPKALWTHEGHLVAGYWYVRALGAERALHELRRRIQHHNEAVGTANTDDSGYHETITRLYAEGIAAHIARNPNMDFEQCLTALLLSPLADRHWPLRHYTAERLFSVRARREWLEPDLFPEQ